MAIVRVGINSNLLISIVVVNLLLLGLAAYLLPLSAVCEDRFVGAHYMDMSCTVNTTQLYIYVGIVLAVFNAIYLFLSSVAGVPFFVIEHLGEDPTLDPVYITKAAIP